MTWGTNSCRGHDVSKSSILYASHSIVEDQEWYKVYRCINIFKVKKKSSGRYHLIEITGMTKYCDIAQVTNRNMLSVKPCSLKRIHATFWYMVTQGCTIWMAIMYVQNHFPEEKSADKTMYQQNCNQQNWQSNKLWISWPQASYWKLFKWYLNGTSVTRLNTRTSCVALGTCITDTWPAAQYNCIYVE